MRAYPESQLHLATLAPSRYLIRSSSASNTFTFGPSNSPLSWTLPSSHPRFHCLPLWIVHFKRIVSSIQRLIHQSFDFHQPSTNTRQDHESSSSLQHIFLQKTDLESRPELHLPVSTNTPSPYRTKSLPHRRYHGSSSQATFDERVQDSQQWAVAKDRGEFMDIICGDVVFANTVCSLTRRLCSSGRLHYSSSTAIVSSMGLAWRYGSQFRY